VRKSVFVEGVRLMAVLVLLSAGHGVGGRFGLAFFGSVLGASVGYVAGGVTGRWLRSATERLDLHTRGISAAELLTGLMGALLAGSLVLVLAVPVWMLLPSPFGWAAAGLLVWIGGHAGFRIGRSRSADLLALARLSDGESAGALDAVLVDTSALVDPRLLGLTRTGFLPHDLLVPHFVLDEIQAMADSHDGAARRRARASLEALEAIRRDGAQSLQVLDDEVPELENVDAKLVAVATRHGYALLTNDEPLSRIAELRGVRCLSLGRLGRCLATALAPGELVSLAIVKEGQQAGEGVGFLDDGSMVVVADTADRLGQEVDVRITSSARTPHGRIFFGALSPVEAPGA